jgi:hypothetical protein
MKSPKFTDRYQAEDAELIWDSRYFPLLISRTKNQTTPGLMKFLAEKRNICCEYAKSTGMRTIHISDASTAQAPDAVNRKIITEMMKEADKPYLNVHFGTVLILVNPLMRGVLTAVAWMAGGDSTPLYSAASMEGAFEQCRKLYGKAGLDVPDFPSNYQFPEFP